MPKLTSYKAIAWKLLSDWVEAHPVTRDFIEANGGIKLDQKLLKAIDLHLKRNIVPALRRKAEVVERNKTKLPFPLVRQSRSKKPPQ